MLWTVGDKGFLPSLDPIFNLPIKNIDNIQFVYVLENLISILPDLLVERQFREEVIYELRQMFGFYNHSIMDTLGGEGELERIFLIFCTFASAYVFAEGEIPMGRVPKEMSIPLSRVSHLCRRYPVLSYTSYVLYNWRKKVYQKGFSLDNIEPIVTFTNLEEEKKLISSFVMAEYDAAKVIKSISGPCEELLRSVQHFFKINNERLQDLDWRTSLYYQDFNKIMFEGWQCEPMRYRCNPFTQTPLISLFARIFGIKFENSAINWIENELKFYRALDHTGFLGAVHSIRHVVEQDGDLKLLYDESLDFFAQFIDYVPFTADQKSAIKTELQKNYFGRS